MTGAIPLTVAMSDYDHMRDLEHGVVRPAGLALTWLNLQIEEIFYRFTQHWEFDVSEMSWGKTTAMLGEPDCPFVPLPVFPSRVFRHSAIYVRPDGGIRAPEDLKGKRIGMPEWAQTAAIYARGMLQHEHGVALDSVHWFQAGVNDAGRFEKVHLDLPQGVRLTPVKDKSLDRMLQAGELDAVISARPPNGFLAGAPHIRRLFPDYQAAERAYFKKTGIFPIMHVVALKRVHYERRPWIARSLFAAFDEARKRSVARALEITASRFPIPWAAYRAAEAQAEFFGGDLWAYGVEANRRTLEAFFRYSFEQGVAKRLLKPEEIFPREVQGGFKV